MSPFLSIASAKSTVTEPLALLYPIDPLTVMFSYAPKLKLPPVDLSVNALHAPLKIHVHCGGLFAHVVVLSGDASSLVAVGEYADEADGTSPWLAQADNASAPIAAAG